MDSQVTNVALTNATTRQDEGIQIRPRKRSRLEMLLLLVPGLLFQLIWGWYPIVMGVMLSFTNGNILRPLSFVGLDNYNRVLTDQVTADAFRNTLIYSGLNLLLTFMIPIIVAILIMEMPRKVVYVMMALWFLPLSSITSLILWRYFYDTNYGLFQFLISGVLHLPHQDFLNDPRLVLFWIIFPNILFFGPGLIYMASLQGIPQSYYEAAEVEGAGFFRKLWTVVLPRLRPIIWMMLVLAIASSLQPFDQMKLLTDGGPQGASRSVMMLVFDLTANLKYGDAAALSASIFFLTLLAVIIFRKLVPEDPDA